jgi:hypothetical protein
LTIHRDASQEEEVISDQGIFEKLFFGHKVKEWCKGNADDGDIGPVLVLGENDHGSLIGKDFLPLRFDAIKNGKNQLGNPFSYGIDNRVSFHNYKSMSNFKIQMPNECQSSKV